MQSQPLEQVIEQRFDQRRFVAGNQDCVAARYNLRIEAGLYAFEEIVVAAE